LTLSFEPPINAVCQRRRGKSLRRHDIAREWFRSPKAARQIRTNIKAKSTMSCESHLHDFVDAYNFVGRLLVNSLQSLDFTATTIHNHAAPENAGLKT
jgi:hypothetical protein